MKILIVLEKKENAYFRTKELFTPEQWAEHFKRRAESILAKNGWVVKEVRIEG